MDRSAVNNVEEIENSDSGNAERSIMTQNDGVVSLTVRSEESARLQNFQFNSSPTVHQTGVALSERISRLEERALLAEYHQMRAAAFNNRLPTIYEEGDHDNLPEAIHRRIRQNIVNNVEAALFSSRPIRFQYGGPRNDSFPNSNCRNSYSSGSTDNTYFGVRVFYGTDNYWALGNNGNETSDSNGYSQGSNCSENSRNNYHGNNGQPHSYSGNGVIDDGYGMNDDMNGHHGANCSTIENGQFWESRGDDDNYYYGNNWPLYGSNHFQRNRNNRNRINRFNRNRNPRNSNNASDTVANETPLQRFLRNFSPYEGLETVFRNRRNTTRADSNNSTKNVDGR